MASPCSSEATPPATAARDPPIWVAWAVTLAPASAAASTTLAISSAVNTGVSASGPSMYSLMRSAPSSSWLERRFEQPIGVGCLDEEVGAGEGPLLADPGAGSPDVGAIVTAVPVIPHRQRQGTFDPSTSRVGEPTSRAQRIPASTSSSPFLSAVASRSSVESLMRSIQWDPPGRETWLCESTIAGTIVAPPASIDRGIGSGIGFLSGRAHPGDGAALHQQADAELQGG